MIKFYSHIITIQSLIVKLDQMGLSEQERLHLAHLLDSTLHHTVLEVVLSELSEQDKVTFVKLHSRNDNEKIMEFLNSKVEKIEDKIKMAAEQLTKELHKDIADANRVKISKKMITENRELITEN